MPGDYEVGYKKPPPRSRFRKGRSGNPKGRPKATKNLKTDLMEELRERILLREGTTQKRVSKQRAMVKSLTAKAIKGDTRAASAILGMIYRLLEDETSAQDDAPLTGEERAVLESLEARFLQRAGRKAGSNAGEKHDSNEKRVAAHEPIRSRASER
jgi:hypothetical protein